MYFICCSLQTNTNEIRIKNLVAKELRAGEFQDNRETKQPAASAYQLVSRQIEKVSRLYVNLVKAHERRFRVRV